MLWRLVFVDRCFLETSFADFIMAEGDNKTQTQVLELLVS